MIDNKKFYNQKEYKRPVLKDVKFRHLGTQGTLLTGSTTGQVHAEADIEHATYIPKFRSVKTDGSLEGSSTANPHFQAKEIIKIKKKAPNFFKMNNYDASTIDPVGHNYAQVKKEVTIPKIRKVHTSEHVSGTTLNQHEPVAKSFARNDKQAPDFFALSSGGSTTDFCKRSLPNIIPEHHSKFNDYLTDDNLHGTTTAHQFIKKPVTKKSVNQKDHERQQKIQDKKMKKLEIKKDKEYASKMKDKQKKLYSIKIPSNGTQTVPKKYGGTS